MRGTRKEVLAAIPITCYTYNQLPESILQWIFGHVTKLTLVNKNGQFLPWISHQSLGWVVRVIKNKLLVYKTVNPFT